jgi:hypothetical protein
MYSIQARTITRSGLAGAITTITTTTATPLHTATPSARTATPAPSPKQCPSSAVSKIQPAAIGRLDRYAGQLLAERRDVVAASAALDAAAAAAAPEPLPHKLVWFYRHGQSFGNVASAAARAADGIQTGEPGYPGPAVQAYKLDESLEDAALTEIGVGQAQATGASNAAAHADGSGDAKPEVVVCSPLTRALQTAALIFERELLAGEVRACVRTCTRACVEGLPLVSI